MNPLAVFTCVCEWVMAPNNFIFAT